MNATENLSPSPLDLTYLSSSALALSPAPKAVVAPEPEAPYLVDAMSPVQRQQFRRFVSMWAAVVVLFAAWWFQPQHVGNVWLFLLNSVVLGCSILLPGYYFFFFSRVTKPNARLRFPSGGRVGMVVTKAPAEPWPLVRTTLEAVLAQNYPHDTWLADEDPTAEVSAWCEEHGVRISTRKGVRHYHQPGWPRRSRCKEGNLAFFYDHYGYELYDFVVQMDADHRPGIGYLEAMLQPFVNPKVGYVSAPSICSANAQESWTARARMIVEAPLHGALQAGYSDGFAPLCIGSHYAVRTCALREIGGLGPELAEDHSTTLMFNAAGWKGVHALAAHAVGEGPETFADFVTQEFQWAKSLTKILLNLTPRLVGRLPLRLKFQFLFSQCWYGLLSLTMLMSIAIPVFAIFTNEPLVRVSYAGFFGFSVALAAVLVAALLWIRRNGWCRPKETKLLTWETVLVQFARWPWIALGIIAACADFCSARTQEEFRVTPKGGESRHAFSPLLIGPYAVLALASGLPVIVVPHANYVSGYYFISALNSLMYAFTAVAIVALHFFETTAYFSGQQKTNA